MNEDFDIGPIMGIMMVMIMMTLLPQQAGAQTASLNGHLRDTAGDPIDGVQVGLSGLPYTTAADGYYEFTNLTPGTFTLEVINAESLGYEYKPPATVTIAAGVNTKDIILTAPTTKANLVGVVRDYSTLSLVSGAEVNLDSHTTTTDANGLFSFHDVDPGGYTITVSRDGYNTKIDDIVLVTGDNTLDIILIPEGVPVSEFMVSDLSVEPQLVGVGETVEISALVTNLGDAAGTCVVDCVVTPTTFTTLQVAVIEDTITAAVVAILSMVAITIVYRVAAGLLSK